MEKWYVVMIEGLNGPMLGIAEDDVTDSIAGPFDTDDEAATRCSELSAELGIPEYDGTDLLKPDTIKLLLRSKADMSYSLLNLWCNLYHRYDFDGQHDKASTVYKFISKLPR